MNLSKWKLNLDATLFKLNLPFTYQTNMKRIKETGELAFIFDWLDETLKCSSTLGIFWQCWQTIAHSNATVVAANWPHRWLNWFCQFNWICLPEQFPTTTTTTGVDWKLQSVSQVIPTIIKMNSVAFCHEQTSSAGLCSSYNVCVCVCVQGWKENSG